MGGNTMSLKELLGEELYSQVEAKLGDDEEIFLASENDGDYVPRTRLSDKNEKIDELNDKIDGLQEQLDERASQLEELKQDTNASEELKEKIKDLEKQNEEKQKEFESKLQEERLENAIEKEALKRQARNPKAVKALLDRESLELTDEGVKNLTEQFDELAESDPYLFEGDSVPDGGSEGFNGEQTSTLTAERINEMSEDEINENWDEIQKAMETGNL